MIDLLFGGILNSGTVVYCCNRPKDAFLWKNVDLGTLDLESGGIL